MIGVNVSMMRESGLTPNEMFFLYEMKTEGTQRLAAMSNIYFLTETGYIDEKGVLTHEGGELIDKVFFRVEKKTTEVSNKELTELSEKFKELFPKGVKTGEYPVRSNIRNIIRKMRKFKKEYPEYTNEVILGATKGYVDRMARNGFQYMKTSEYLIFKGGESVLANLCEAYKDGGEREERKFGRTV